MSRPGFFPGAVFALVAALAAAASFTALGPWLGAATALRAITAAAGFAYLLFLLNRAPGRVGRITSVSLWAGVAALLWWTAPNLAVFLLGHVGLLWLIRSAYFYSGLLPAVADLLLSGFSIAVGIWAASRSGSLGLSVWTFFLVQSLFVFIPRTVSKPETVGRRRSGQDPFDKARRSAEAALRRLATSDRQL